jgi:hypothetical protein
MINGVNALLFLIVARRKGNATSIPHPARERLYKRPDEKRKHGGAL